MMLIMSVINHSGTSAEPEERKEFLFTRPEEVIGCLGVITELWDSWCGVPYGAGREDAL